MTLRNPPGLRKPSGICHISKCWSVWTSLSPSAQKSSSALGRSSLQDAKILHPRPFRSSTPVLYRQKRITVVLQSPLLLTPLFTCVLLYQLITITAGLLIIHLQALFSVAELSPLYSRIFLKLLMNQRLILLTQVLLLNGKRRPRLDKRSLFCSITQSDRGPDQRRACPQTKLCSFQTASLP